MHNEGAAARGRYGGDKPLQAFLAVLVVDADAALHGNGHADARGHRGDARADELGLLHQAGAETALLHAIGRAANVEVDFVVAEAFPDRRRLGECGRLRAAELQRDRVLGLAECEQARAVAVEHGWRGHHLGVKPRMPRQDAMEGPAVPVRPVHHRGDAEPMALKLH